MTKREKIIIAMMIAAIMYGLFDFLFSAPTQHAFDHSAQRLKQLNAFASAVTRKLTGHKTTDTAMHILSLALSKWDKDPMAGAEASWLFDNQQPTAPKTTPDVKFFYTGYLKTHDKTVAIINGLEYAPGEALEEPGYVLRSVSPTHIIIKAQDGNKQMVIPLDETTPPNERHLQLKVGPVKPGSSHDFISK